MSGRVYAQVSDITRLGVTLTAAQSEAAQAMLESASAKLRLTASQYGADIDRLIDDPVRGADYAEVVKSVVVQAVIRGISSIGDTALSPAVTQASQSGLGYSASMTYLNAGQSLYFLRSELKELGLLRQKYGGLAVYHYADDQGN